MQKAQTLIYRHFPHSTSQILRYSTEDTPSILHRYSIDGPSFRWSIDGRAMEEHKNILGIYPENTQRKILSFIFIHK